MLNRRRYSGCGSSVGLRLAGISARLACWPTGRILGNRIFAVRERHCRWLGQVSAVHTTGRATGGKRVKGRLVVGGSEAKP